MNIALMINNLKIGGAESLAVNLMKCWNAAGHRVFLIQGDPSCEYPKIEHLPVAGTLIAGIDQYAVFRTAYFLYRNKIDICFAHLERSNKIAACAGILLRVPVWGVMHSINIYPKYSRKARIVGWIYRHLTSGMIAISDSVRDYMIELGIPKNHIRLILNGVNSAALQKCYVYKPSDKLSLLFVGRVEPVKGLNYLLEALARFDKENPAWHLTIVGHGSVVEELQLQAKQIGIAGKIEWVGADNEPWKHLRQARVLCLTSVREGLPITLLEGMSIGIPMLVSRVGYLPKLVDDSCGRLCTPGAVEEIVMQLRYFAIADKTTLMRMSENARQRVAPYNIETCAENYLKVIEK